MPYTSLEPMQTFGCSLPKALVEEVDRLRGDVGRSRYIQRLIEKYAIVQTDPRVRAQEQLAPSVTKRSKS